jgi:small multidrug resistance pump
MSSRLFGEAITPLMWLGMALVVAGVLLVELGSHSAPAHDPTGGA